MSQFEMQMEELKAKLSEARRLGVVEGPTSGAFTVLLSELLQETEKRRQALVLQADTFESQAKSARAQAGAFQVFGSIANAVLGGMIHQAKRAIEEEADRELRLKAEREEAEADARKAAALSAPSDAPGQEAAEASDKTKPSRAKKPSKAP